MAGYLAMRIEDGALNYNAVVAKYPQFKADIDIILACDGYSVHPDGSVTKKQR